MTSNNKKVVVAFSGGLDTSYAVVWLIEQGYEVITCTVDTGGFPPGELETIGQKSGQLGANKHVLIDAGQEYLDQFVSYLIKAHYLRGGIYPPITSAPRYLEISRIVEIAQQEDASAIAHGCTGAGNDQVRYDTTIRILAPELQIIAPYRDLELSRQAETDYLQSKGFEVEEKTTDYSLNFSVLGVTICGKELNGTAEPLPDDVYPTVKPLEQTSDTPAIVELSFEQGIPCAINGEEMGLGEVFTNLAKIGAEHGVGKAIHLGETLLGIKARVAIEAPAYFIISKAHQELCKIVLSKQQLFWLQTLGTVYGDMIHESEYYNPFTKDLQAFLDSTNKKVKGTVKLKLFKGSSFVEGLDSPYSLFNSTIAVYAEGNPAWSGADARGFCNLSGVGNMLAYQASKKNI